MLSEPSIIQQVKHFDFQGVEIVMHWNEEFLPKIKLIIKDLSRVDHIRVA